MLMKSMISLIILVSSVCWMALVTVISMMALV
jgi:hypothetical protein